ncbi:hypothetical protein LZ554_004161 [Drepanopeziza brunnea f. sp. 'monogermtubi']|nr:hypothetical protein LZ554_004161 [Drepanopeziza brunnea f. sp. 'monogermtubi']
MDMCDIPSEASSRAASYGTPQPALTRKAHRKSKNGCLVCKKRRIKCDETHPECGNCTRHSSVCEYPPLKTSLVPQNGNLAAKRPLEINLVDLELLHHFTTVTAATLHNDPSVKRLWTTTVPQLGYKHDFVMHGILAISALHIGYYYPERKEYWTKQASLHHRSSLAKATPALSDVNETNAAELYIFSVLTCLCTYATLIDTDDPVTEGPYGLAQYITVSRQSDSIARMVSDSLRAGPLGVLISSDRRWRWCEQVSHDTLSGARELRELSAVINQRHSDPRIKEAYQTAIDDLLNIFHAISVMSPEMREASDAFVWPSRLTDEYLELLRQPTQEALVILAYFAVLPEQIDSAWWLEGFGRRLFWKIYPLIQDDYLHWIQWPLREIERSPGEQSRSQATGSTQANMGS